MVFKVDWEKADKQYQVPPNVIVGMIKQAYPGKALISHQVIDGGCANINIKINLQGDEPPYILRIYFRDKSAAYREQKLGDLLKQIGIAPAVYYVGDYQEYKFAITEYIPGITLRDLLLSNEPHDVQNIMQHVGELLAKISSYTFPKAGFFDENLNVKEENTSSGSYLSFAQEYLNNKIVIEQLTPQLIAKIEQYLDKHENFFPAQNENHLVHADFDPANILVNKIGSDWQVTGVMDWEFAFSGSVLWDVANMLRYAHEVPPMFAESFLHGLSNAGLNLPDDWQVSIDLLNLLSLFDCLVRSAPTKQPNRCADICKLIKYITGT